MPIDHDTLLELSGFHSYLIKLRAVAYETEGAQVLAELLDSAENMLDLIVLSSLGRGHGTTLRQALEGDMSKYPEAMSACLEPITAGRMRGGWVPS